MITHRCQLTTYCIQPNYATPKQKHSCRSKRGGVKVGGIGKVGVLLRGMTYLDAVAYRRAYK